MVLIAPSARPSKPVVFPFLWARDVWFLVILIHEWRCNGGTFTLPVSKSTPESAIIRGSECSTAQFVPDPSQRRINTFSDAALIKNM